MPEDRGSKCLQTEVRLNPSRTNVLITELLSKTELLLLLPPILGNSAILLLLLFCFKIENKEKIVRELYLNVSNEYIYIFFPPLFGCPSEKSAICTAIIRVSSITISS